MSKVAINYQKVDSTTTSIKSAAKENLKNYANSEYKTLKEAMSNCKGDYKTAIVEELEEERKAVIAAAEFVVKLQKMIKKTSDSFEKLDKSYKKGAKIEEK